MIIITNINAMLELDEVGALLASVAVPATITEVLPELFNVDNTGAALLSIGEDDGGTEVSFVFNVEDTETESAVVVAIDVPFSVHISRKKQELKIKLYQLQCWLI
jgi:hypothetical protein